MRLVQKTMIGLSLAGSLMMSSCSKEDAQMPEPEVNVNESSTLKTSALKPILLPYFAPTVGPKGDNVFPQQWSKFLSASQNPYWISVGTSGLQYPYGSTGYPVQFQWQFPLPSIPGLPDDISILTSVGCDNDDAKGYQYTGVKTKITQLTPGKKYEITFYVCAGKMPGVSSAAPYAPGAKFSIDGIAAPIADEVLFGAGPLATQWVKKKVQFTASSNEVLFSYWPKDPTVKKEKISVNIFVDKNAIKQIN